MFPDDQKKKFLGMCYKVLVHVPMHHEFLTKRIYGLNLCILDRKPTRVLEEQSNLK